MGVKLRISTDNQQCFAGDAVEGTVHVDVISTNAEGSSADTLMLRLVGLAKTHTIRDRQNDHNHDRQQNNFLSHEMQLASFGGRVAVGSHRFPFSLVLPEGLPSSMEEKRFNSGGCSIAYAFEARLHRPGFLKSDSKATSGLKVLRRPQETAAPAPVLVGPENQTVRTCCCFDSGSMCIGFEADRSVVGVNEPVGITVVALNGSLSSVNSIIIAIVQVCTWYARGTKETKTRTIASLTVPWPQLGEVQRVAAQHVMNRQKPAAGEDAAPLYFQELMDAGAGTRYELSARDDSLLTVQTSLIDVRHSLNVRFKTPALISTPDVSMPLRIQAETVESGSPVEAEPVGLPYAMAVPYATKIGGGESGGYPKPVVIPQSAVTMEFNTELPQLSAPVHGQFHI